MADIKIGGPKNFYHPNTDVKKLGLDKAAVAINNNTAKNEEQDDELDDLDLRVTALENAPQPSGVGPEVIADLYQAEGDNPEYEQGDVVSYYDGYTNEFYEALEDTTAEPTDHTAWQAIHIEDIPALGGMVPAGGYAIANETLYHNAANYPTWFDPANPGADFEVVNYTVWAKVAKVYNPGDYAMYADELYVCDHRASGAFDPDDWTKINVMSQLSGAGTIFECAFTYDEDDNEYFCNKSHAQIIAAINAGKHVYATALNRKLIYTGTDTPSAFERIAFSVVLADSSDHLVMHTFTINEDERVVYSHHDIDAGGVLPAYSSDESGKVLQVNNIGDLVWANAGGGGGVTFLDNDKFQIGVDSDNNPVYMVRKTFNNGQPKFVYFDAGKQLSRIYSMSAFGLDSQDRYVFNENGLVPIIQETSGPDGNGLSIECYSSTFVTCTITIIWVEEDI